MDEGKMPGKSSLWTFFVITFVYSWALWLPGILQSRGVISTPVPLALFVAIGSFGPFVSSFSLTYKREGRSGVQRLWARAFDRRISWRWLALIVFLPLFVAGIALYLKVLSGGEKPDLRLATDPVGILVTFPFLFFFGGAFAEEFGWRGYALDHLQRRYDALVSSLVLGLLWGLWHAPLFFAEGLTQAYVSFWAFLVWTMSSSIIFTLVHNHTHGSVLAALLLHTMINLSISMFPVIEMKQGGDQSGFTYAVVLQVILSMMAVFIWGRKKLCRVPRARRWTVQR